VQKFQQKKHWRRGAGHALGEALIEENWSRFSAIMVLGLLLGRSSNPPTPSRSGGKNLVVIDEKKLVEEEEGWSEVPDTKDRTQSAGTGTTTEEEGTEGVDEAWDWALEGDSSEGSVNQYVFDDFLVQGEETTNPKVGTSEDAKPAEPWEHSLAEAALAPEEPEDEFDSFRCRGCHVVTFKGSDIMSSNYQAMTGPGYLIGATRHTVPASETQSVVYTTGTYIIREVSCEFCDNKLGVTYCVAPDARNEYKVGKFLFGADRLVLPPGVTHPKVRS